MGEYHGQLYEVDLQKLTLVTAVYFSLQKFLTDFLLTEFKT